MKAPWTYFLSPAWPGPQRGLIEPGHGRGGDQGADQPHHLRGQGCRLRQAGMDEAVRDGGAGHVGDQLPAPLHRDVLEDHQVNGQGPQPGADGQGGVRHARRARRDMRPAAGAAHFVQVVLDPLRRRGRDLLLLRRPGDAQVLRVRQVQAARAGTLRVMLLGPVRDLPRHRRPRAARLLPPLLLLRAFRRPPLLPRHPPAGQVIRRRRHRGVPAVPRRRPQSRLQLLPQVSDHRLQRHDPLRLRLKPRCLLTDQRITGILRRRRIGHSPRSSRKPHPAITAAPHPTPNRNHDHPPQRQAQAPECLQRTVDRGFRTADIVISEPAKSGATWMRTLCAILVSDVLKFTDTQAPTGAGGLPAAAQRSGAGEQAKLRPGERVVRGRRIRDQPDCSGL